MYRTLGDVQETKRETRWVSDPNLGWRSVLVVTEMPTTSLQLNDFAVTLKSSRINGFMEIASVLGNHATIATPANGYRTIAAIKRAQPLGDVYGEP